MKSSHFQSMMSQSESEKQLKDQEIKELLKEVQSEGEEPQQLLRKLNTVKRAISKLDSGNAKKLNI